MEALGFEQIERFIIEGCLDSKIPKTPCYAMIHPKSFPFGYPVFVTPPVLVDVPTLVVRAPQRPSIWRTPSRTFFSYSERRSRHILAASTLAGLSSLGSASMLMTEMRIFSTDWMGLQRSEACS